MTFNIKEKLRMNFLILTNMYPKDGQFYRNAFVHRRVVNYKKNNSQDNFDVFVLNNNYFSQNSYIYEGIQVMEGKSSHLLSYLELEKPDKILVHFLDFHMMDVIENINFKIPVIIWVHGVEALGWYRRLFNFDFFSFPKYIIRNSYQMIKFRNFIEKSNNKDVHFVFVSDWMRKTLEKDTGRKIKNYSIIPNVIDTKLFPYHEKDKELRKKVLLIRPFSSKKYANDLAIKAIKYLSVSWKYFDNLTFTIIGEGKYFDKLTNPLKGFSNVHLINHFIEQKDIACFHKKHGVFLCPTRQDAQGVSMCEAMSSGLVPITSNNTAIPEYVEHYESGILTNNYKEIAESLIKVYDDIKLFENMSRKASEDIYKKCRESLVISKEISLISE